MTYWMIALFELFGFGLGCALTYLTFRSKIKLANDLLAAKDDGELHDVKDEAGQ